MFVRWFTEAQFGEIISEGFHGPTFLRICFLWILKYTLLPCPPMGPNNFGSVPIVLDRSNLFWLDPNHFKQSKNYEK